MLFRSRIEVDDREVRGEIEDDGCGMAAGGPGGLGIGSMQARAARLGGVFRLAARAEGGGTTATLRFPLKARKA